MTSFAFGDDKMKVCLRAVTSPTDRIGLCTLQVSNLTPKLIAALSVDVQSKLTTREASAPMRVPFAAMNSEPGNRVGMSSPIEEANSFGQAERHAPESHMMDTYPGGSSDSHPNRGR